MPDQREEIAGERAAPGIKQCLARILLPEHLADLRRSGLREETINAADFRSLTSSEFLTLPEEIVADKIVQGAYFIPYPGYEPFARIRLIPEPKDGPKYWQPPGSAVHLYFPPGFEEALRKRPNDIIYIVEGEKKALALFQAGYLAIGIAGPWNWLKNGKVIEDFARLGSLAGRDIRLVPDSDTWMNLNLLKANFALAAHLDDLSAKVKVIRIPDKPDGSKQGVDDFLLEHSLKNFESLKCIALDVPVFKTVRKWYRNKWQRERHTLRDAYGCKPRLHGVEGGTHEVDHYLERAGDGIFYIKRDAEGAETEVRLTNFTAHITDDVLVCSPSAQVGQNEEIEEGRV